MKDGERELQLHVVGLGGETKDRAVVIVDRLAADRLVAGGFPEWRVTYSDVDSAEAMKLLETDLTEIDPRWVEVLDFEAVPSTPMSEAEFS